MLLALASAVLFIASLRSSGRASLDGEFIGVLLVAQQRAVNTRTFIVAQSRFEVSAFQKLRMG
jgi:hypothetical protein